MYNAAWEVHKPRTLHIASYRKLKRPAAGGRAGRSPRKVGNQSFLSIELPNEIYYTDDGKALDAVGVPPDIHMQFFTPDDLQASRDAALDEAIRQLTNSSD